MRPIAVLISDIHYNIQTLEVADKATTLAINKANELGVRLIVAGDLHDTKANIRAECINRMMDTFCKADIQPIVLRGNHDQINEKSEDHALNFLGGIVHIIDVPNVSLSMGGPQTAAIPYQHDPDEFRRIISGIPKSTVIIAHQGLANSSAGHYIMDKSAINPTDVAGRRIISGHYHNRQTIELPDGGRWDYIGNPYTLNFGEAEDNEKGFQILYEDGSLEFVPTNLRKHVVFDITFADMCLMGKIELPMSDNPEDLVWVKVRGTREELAQVTSTKRDGCKLDLIPLDSESKVENQENLTQVEILTKLIDSTTGVSPERKARLQTMWRKLYDT